MRARPSPRQAPQLGNVARPWGMTKSAKNGQVKLDEIRRCFTWRVPGEGLRRETGSATKRRSRMRVESLPVVIRTSEGPVDMERLAAALEDLARLAMADSTGTARSEGQQGGRCQSGGPTPRGASHARS